MIKKAVFSIILIIISTQAYAGVDLSLLDVAPNFQGCNKVQTYWMNDGRQKMVALLKKAIGHIEKEDDSQSRAILAAALKRYFQTDLDSPSWQAIKDNIHLVVSQIGSTRYMCDSDENRLTLCQLTGAAAITPPEKNRVLICKKTFDRAIFKMKAILLHESIHQYGKNIDYLSEVYCRRFNKVKPSPERLLKTPDAYMLFLVELGQDGRPDYSNCL